MMTDPERDAAVRAIREDLSGIRSLLKLLLGVVFVTLAILSISGVVTSRISSNSREVSQQNRAFLQNFSDYMRCLIVTDQEAVKAFGIEPYFNLCDELLFRNTGLVPMHTKITIPSTTTTTLGG